MRNKFFNDSARFGYSGGAFRGHTMTESSGTKNPLDFMNTVTEAAADDVVPEARAIQHGSIPPLEAGLQH
jgi:hypothetical protein